MLIYSRANLLEQHVINLTTTSVAVYLVTGGNAEIMIIQVCASFPVNPLCMSITSESSK